jgi:hypothetical protein
VFDAEEFIFEYSVEYFIENLKTFTNFVAGVRNVSGTENSVTSSQTRTSISAKGKSCSLYRMFCVLDVLFRQFGYPKKMIYKDQMQKIKEQWIKDLFFVGVSMYQQETTLNNSNGTKTNQQPKQVTPSENYNRIVDFLNRWIKAGIISEDFCDLANRSLESYSEDDINIPETVDYSNSVDTNRGGATSTNVTAQEVEKNTVVVEEQNTNTEIQAAPASTQQVNIAVNTEQEHQQSSISQQQQEQINQQQMTSWNQQQQQHMNFQHQQQGFNMHGNMSYNQQLTNQQQAQANSYNQFYNPYANGFQPQQVQQYQQNFNMQQNFQQQYYNHEQQGYYMALQQQQENLTMQQYQCYNNQQYQQMAAANMQPQQMMQMQNFEQQQLHQQQQLQLQQQQKSQLNMKRATIQIMIQKNIHRRRKYRRKKFLRKVLQKI